MRERRTGHGAFNLASEVGMTDNENPYASPGRVEEFDELPEGPKAPPDPGISRTLTVGLVVNVLSVPLSELLPDLRQNLDRGNHEVLADVVRFLTGANLLWAAMAWPVVSLTALIYTATRDRHTRWWLPKSIAAAILLLVWLLVVLLVFSMQSPDDMEF